MSQLLKEMKNEQRIFMKRYIKSNSMKRKCCVLQCDGFSPVCLQTETEETAVGLLNDEQIKTISEHQPPRRMLHLLC